MTNRISDINEELLNNLQDISSNLTINKQKKSVFNKMYNYLFSPIQKENREINVNGEIYPLNYTSNKWDNTNYNFITFVPKFLYKQFNSVSNLFYLLWCITQFFQVFKVGNLISFLFPLLFIIFLSGIKEIYQEFKKYYKDKSINVSKYLKFNKNKFTLTESQYLKVGDIIKLKKNERVPCDLVVLWSNDENGSTNVKTDQIDGETDWKIRKSIKFTQNQIDDYWNNDNNNNKLWNGKIIIDAPNDKIYDINGNYIGDNENDFQKIRLENSIWANMKLMTNEVIGIVIYAGKECKLSLNSKASNVKNGKIEKEINKITIILFGLITIFALLLTTMSGMIYEKDFILSIIRNFVILSSIIPISLKANIDLAKIYYMYQINNEKSIEGTILRNSYISEELGRVEYLLSDKTGTLTQNKMIFKTFALKNKIFKEYDFSKIKDIISNSNSQLKNIESNVFINTEITSKINSNKMNNGEKIEVKRQLINFLETLILCHNVTPVIIDGERILQASSPDEVSLVNFIESLGFKLLSRNEKYIEYEDINKVVHKYEIVENFPFTSERKRMGILLKSKGEYRFLLKGADSVINPKLKDKDSIFSFEQTENMSKNGLRTLVFAENYFSEEFYKEWKNKYNQIQKSNNFLALEGKWIERLEKNIKFVGVSGVEDLLQDNVKKVIYNVREAGIKVWMLTGDKAETAKCIAISTGFKANNQNFYEIMDNLTLKEISKKLQKYNKKDLLLISGSVLDKILKNEKIKNYFLKISSESNSVVICRCAPKQKSQMTLLIKNKLKKVVCSIGDGGNDVGMIKSASFGVGIEGLEGKQAALSSDASILYFKYIENLLFWHGRLNYLRTCKIFHFSISRGLIITFIQMYFMFLFYFISINLYNSNLIMLYSSVYTSFLIFALLHDEDLPKSQAYNYPILYKYVQKGIYLNMRQFLKYICVSIFQSFVIFISYIVFFKNNLNNIITITFSSLILVEIINTFLLVRKFNKVIYISSFLTLFIYILFSYIGPSFFDFSRVNLYSLLHIIILTWGATLPLIIFKVIKFYFFPSPIEKVIKEANKRSKKKDFFHSLNL